MKRAAVLAILLLMAEQAMCQYSAELKDKVKFLTFPGAQGKFSQHRFLQVYHYFTVEEPKLVADPNNPIPKIALIHIDNFVSEWLPLVQNVNGPGNTVYGQVALYRHESEPFVIVWYKGEGNDFVYEMIIRSVLDGCRKDLKPELLAAGERVLKRMLTTVDVKELQGKQ